MTTARDLLSQAMEEDWKAGNLPEDSDDEADAIAATPSGARLLALADAATSLRSLTVCEVCNSVHWGTGWCHDQRTAPIAALAALGSPA